jgi:hypothetical protein
MERTASTPRLKLTLVTAAERGGPELKWIHEIRSNEQSTWWRYFPRILMSFSIN